MKEWILGINSILFPESMPCEAYIDGLWRECILTGKLSDDGSGRLSMTVTFPNATVIKAGGTRNSFFIEPENN